MSAAPEPYNSLTRWLTAVMIVISVVGLLGVGTAVYIHHTLKKYDGISGWIAAHISPDNSTISVEIDKIDYTIKIAEQQIEVSLYDILLSDSAQRISIPKTMLVFDWGSVLSLSPAEIQISSAGLDLVYQNGNWQTGSDEGWLAQLIGSQLIQSDSNGTTTPELPRWLMSTRNISVSGDYLRIYERTISQNAALYFSPFRLSFSIDDPAMPHLVTIQAMLTQTRADTEKRGVVNLTARYDALSALTDMALSAQHVDVTELYALLDMPQIVYQQNLPDVSAQMNMLLDGTKLVSVDADIQAENGVLSIPQMPSPFMFERVSTSFSYSEADSLLALSSAQITLAEGDKLTLSGQVFGLDLPQWAFKGNILAEDITIDDLLSGWQSFATAQPASTVQNHFSGGRFQTITMEFAGTIDSVAQLVSVNQLTATGDFVNLRLGYASDQYEQIVGTVSGKIETDILPGGVLGRLVVDMALTDGFARIKGLNDTIKIPLAALVLRSTPEQVTINKLEMDLAAHGFVSVSGRRMNMLPRPETQLTVTAPQLDGTALAYLWPEPLAPTTRTFIRQRFVGGRLENIDVSFLVREEMGTPRIIETEGQFNYFDGQFTWRDGLPAVDIERSEIRFVDNKMLINSAQSQYDGLALRQAEVEYAPVIAPRDQERILKVQMTGGGDLAPVLRVLSHPGINQLEKLGLQNRSLAGQTDFKLVTEHTKLWKQPLRLQHIEVDAALDEFQMDRLPLQSELTGAQLELNYRIDEVQISGSGLIDQAPAEFTYVQQPSGQVTLNSKFTPSEALRLKLAPLLPVDITGKLAGKVIVNGNVKTSTFTADITADLAQTGVSYELLDWAKLPLEQGSAKFVADVRNGKLYSVNDIQLNAGTLVAQGRMQFDQSAKISELLLGQLRYPGTDLSSVVIEQREGTGIAITAEGRQLDLTPFLTPTSSEAEQPSLIFDITADVMNAGSGITLTGHVKGTKKPDSGPEATLQGQVRTPSGILIDQTTLDAKFGYLGFEVAGSGLIGGGEVSIDYTSSKRTGRHLVLASQSGGRVLNGLGITDAIRGGVLDLKTEFDDQDDKRFTTTIQLEDFNVVEGVQALRAYSVLSLAGLYSLIEGEGANFVKGEAVIASDNGRHQFSKVRASGPALGVNLVGSYDTTQGVVDVSGNLVPISQISSLIGTLPLLGEILTGIDKSGVLVNQFSIRGDVDDPEVIVNPVSLIAPGVLRDLLSPNWLGSEAERILGPQTQ